MGTLGVSIGKAARGLGLAREGGVGNEVRDMTENLPGSAWRGMESR